MHTHSDTPTAPLSDFLFLFFTCVFSSTFTVIKAYIASPPLSRVKWFVTICVDTEIIFSSEEVLSRQCFLLQQHSHSWGLLYFCSHSFSLWKQQILYTLGGTWGRWTCCTVKNLHELSKGLRQFPSIVHCVWYNFNESVDGCTFMITTHLMVN